MSPQLRLVVIALSILLIAHRAPAPIIEPTPSSEEQSKQPARSKRRSSETSEPARPRERFAGTWTGKINQGIVGDVVFTLTFAAGGSQVTEHTSFGTYSHPVTSNGQTGTWKSGLLNDVTWTFTLNSNGSSAHVTAKSMLGVNGDATFHRGGTPAEKKVASEFPTAKPVPEQPGFVYNPFDPTSRVFIDVRGKPSGTKLVDPKSGKAFIVP